LRGVIDFLLRLLERLTLEVLLLDRPTEGDRGAAALRRLDLLLVDFFRLAGDGEGADTFRLLWLLERERDDIETERDVDGDLGTDALRLALRREERLRGLLIDERDETDADRDVERLFGDFGTDAFRRLDFRLEARGTEAFRLRRRRVLLLAARFLRGLEAFRDFDLLVLRDLERRLVLREADRDRLEDPRLGFFGFTASPAASSSSAARLADFFEAFCSSKYACFSLMYFSYFLVFWYLATSFSYFLLAFSALAIYGFLSSSSSEVQREANSRTISVFLESLGSSATTAGLFSLRKIRYELDGRLGAFSSFLNGLFACFSLNAANSFWNLVYFDVFLYASRSASYLALALLAFAINGCLAFSVTFLHIPPRTLAISTIVKSGLSSTTLGLTDAAHCMYAERGRLGACLSLGAFTILLQLV